MRVREKKMLKMFPLLLHFIQSRRVLPWALLLYFASDRSFIGETNVFFFFFFFSNDSSFFVLFEYLLFLKSKSGIIVTWLKNIKEIKLIHRETKAGLKK